MSIFNRESWKQSSYTVKEKIHTEIFENSVHNKELNMILVEKREDYISNVKIH